MQKLSANCKMKLTKYIPTTRLSANIVIVVIFCFINLRTCTPSEIDGPLRFYLQYSLTETRYLEKVGDKCIDAASDIGIGIYNVGLNTYDAILVCENGYLLPHIYGDSITGKWEDGNNLDSPTADIIAVALLNNTLIDNWYDYGCFKHSENNAYFLEDVCKAKIKANAISNTTESTDIYYFQPAYGATATRSNYIHDWIAAGQNSLSYFSLHNQFDGAFGFSVRESTFASPGETFVGKAVNNVMARPLQSTEYSGVTTLYDGLVLSWASCISWYKVSQPPEIVDKQNTFQFVLACGQRAMVATCVAIFDYFELMYIENNGIYLRAGINGPSLGKRQSSLMMRQRSRKCIKPKR